MKNTGRGLLMLLASAAAYCGLSMAAEPGPEDSLFEATGEYAGNFVDLRLADEPAVSGGGRYVLYLTVEPGAAPESARMPIPKAITKAGR